MRENGCVRRYALERIALERMRENVRVRTDALERMREKGCVRTYALERTR